MIKPDNLIQIKKRSGEVVDFDSTKIEIAISKAYVDVNFKTNQTLTREIAKDVVLDLDVTFADRIPSVEDVQNTVERKLMEKGLFEVAKSYIIYRYEHTKERAAKKEAILQKADTNQLMITKRSGQKEAFSLEKLQKSLEVIVGEYAADIDVATVVNQVRLELYEDITTAEIERALIMVLRAYTEKDPAYSFVAARALANKIYKEVIGADKIDFTPGVLEAQMRQTFIEKIRECVSMGRLDPRMLTFNLEYVASELVIERDNFLNYLAVQTLYDRYLTRNSNTKQVLETPQMFWMRVAMGIALEEADKEARAVEFYRITSTLHFVPSSPTLFHSGTIHSQLSSCYLTTIEDDLNHIFKSIGDNAQMSKWAGGVANDWSKLRGTGALIKNTGVESQGVIPFLKIANDTTVAINRSGRRRGATCAYLETWHWDIEDFLELRKNTGDDRRRTHDMNTANWVPDLFMQRVKEGGMWSLFSPDETPDLHELYGEEFKKRYEQYEQRGLAGGLKLFRQLPAKDLWKKMLTMLFETGHPWVTFKDPSNIRSPQDHTGVVHSSNLCTEITLNTSAEETAVCNLGSVNLARHVRKGELDIEKIQYTVSIAMRMLDNVIDLNFYPTIEGKTSNMKHRPVGLGVMGFQDALYQMNINFDSEEMVKLADYSQEAISYYAILASTQLAKERGAYASFRGSKWDRGILPVDTIALLERERGTEIPVSREAKMDWSIVRDAIKEHGMRNSNTMAIAPTATISNISGAIPSIEPIYKNIYVKSNISGDFVVVNHYLVKELKERGLWNDDMLTKLKFYDGRVTEIPEVPQDIKDKYKEVFEVDARWLIKAAAHRGKWIDQSQSLNIFYAGTSGKDINDIYLFAWDMGVKTTYYLRTLAVSQVEKSTVSTSEMGSTHIRAGKKTEDVIAKEPVSQPSDEAVPQAVPVVATAAVAPEAEMGQSVAEPVMETTSVPQEEVKESVTIKVEPEAPQNFAASLGLTQPAPAMAGGIDLQQTEFKMCRLDEPDCEACQ
ncbi:MAG TPA: ribonucleoside-diphosphate reductase subunit alpha [Candidatus Doudnabacteria bacterium]|nr:ribonucleoside-diphosphate reductase subunit alpha [Candidatus Doudnabacteria bacterium]